jgi:hypothetical protein
VTAQLSPPFCGGCTAGHVKPHVVQTLPHVSSHAIDKSSIIASKWTSGNYPRSFRWNYRQLFPSVIQEYKVRRVRLFVIGAERETGSFRNLSTVWCQKAAETHWHIQKGVDFRSVCSSSSSAALSSAVSCLLAGLPFYVVVLCPLDIAQWPSFEIGFHN